MNKQLCNIKLIAGGFLRFKTGRIEKPKNKITKIENGVVYFKMNRDLYTGMVNVEDYFRLSLWAHRLTVDHIGCYGIIAYDNGYEHKSLPAAIMQTSKSQKVRYKNDMRKFNVYNCTRDNLVVKTSVTE